MIPREPSIGALAFLQDLWALDHELQTFSKRMLRLHGVSGPQRLLVRVVSRHAGCSPGEAAEFLRLHPATVTRLAARLAESGLIERRVDPSDARRIRLVLTPRGRRVEALQRGTVETVVRDVLEASAPARVRAARALLAALTARLSRKEAGRARSHGGSPPRPGRGG